MLEVSASGLVVQQIGQPLAADVPLYQPGDPDAPTTLWADGARGSADGASSDEIWLYRQETRSYWRHWLYDSSVASPYDGSWIDLGTGSPTTAVLEKGQGWWYRSYPDARDPGFTWTEPVPY